MGRTKRHKRAAKRGDGAAGHGKSSSGVRDSKSVDVLGESAAALSASPSDGGHLRLAFDDPLSALPETARKLLIAAKQIVATEGLHALTLSSVSLESGENKAMVAYYFGNKAGLIAAVLDSVIHDEYLASQQRMRGVEPQERTQRLVEEMRRMDAEVLDFRVFFELLPHMLRHPALRERVAKLYLWYWSEKLEWLGVPTPTDSLTNPGLLGLAQILSAVIDGLAIQAAIDPDLDLTNPYRVFHTMLEGSLLAMLEDNGVSARAPVDDDTSLSANGSPSG